MSEYERAVFISYAWSGEQEEIVNQIEQALRAQGLRIIRDKRDLGYKGSISEFMKRIGTGDCVIVVISDKYLRSPNCMFELVEIAENKQFYDRIFPIVLADADIYRPVRQIQYIKHWEAEIKELKETLGTVDPTHLEGIYEQLNLYDRIRDNISRLTAIVSDMNTLTPEMHQEADFTQLYDALLKRMRNGSVANNIMPAVASHPKETSTPKKERKPMDPITLATAVTTLLAPYIKKAGEKALDKLADQLPESIGKVWDSIANRFKDKQDVADAANELAKNPENADNEVFFKMELKKALAKDESFASELTDLIEQAKSDSSINIGGNGVIADHNSIAVGRDVNISGNSGSTISFGNVQSGSSQKK